MDFKLNNFSHLQPNILEKKAEKKEAPKEEEKAQEQKPVAPEAKPITADAAKIMAEYSQAAINEGIKTSQVAIEKQKVDVYEDLVALWNAKINNNEEKFTYDEKLALLERIIKVAPTQETKVEWTVVKVNVVQNDQLSMLNNLLNNGDFTNIDFDQVLEPWANLLDPEHVIGNGGDVSPDLVEPWELLGNYYYSNPGSILAHSIEDANTQSWRVLEAAIKLKLMDPNNTPEMIQSLQQKLAVCQSVLGN